MIILISVYDIFQNFCLLNDILSAYNTDYTDFFLF